MRIRVFVLFAILLLSCNVERRADMPAKQLFPHQEGAADCLKRIDADPLLGEGARRLLEIAAGKAPFRVKLRDLQAARAEIVARYRALPEGKQDFRDENDFVCVADDLLEGIFAAEIDRLKSLGKIDRVDAGFEELKELLGAIELDPSWNDYARARLLGRMDTD